jgi:hypothetical protein
LNQAPTGTLVFAGHRKLMQGSLFGKVEMGAAKYRYDMPVLAKVKPELECPECGVSCVAENLILIRSVWFGSEMTR